MEKFIEELVAGDIFELEDQKFVITSDFKKNGERLCVNLHSGNVRWFKSDSHVIHINLYAMDSNNNFHPIKEIKSDVSTKNPSIF
jgi:hypothetical protein